MKVVKRLQIIVLLSITLIHSGFSQSAVTDENVKSWQLKSYAKSAERTGDVFSALDYWEAYAVRFPNDLKISRQMAELYRAARDYENAGFNYLKTYHLNIDRYTQSLYYYALMEKMQGNYDRAIEYFEKFLAEYRGQKDSRAYRKLAKVEIEGCQLALQLQEKRRKQIVVLKHLNSSINKAHVELSPTYIDDTKILYASLPADEINYYPADDTTNWPVRQLFTATKLNDKWIGGKPFEGPFNQKGVNTINGAYSPDGRRFYFNRCHKNWQSKTICHIYISQKINDEWQTPEKADDQINLDSYTSTQPTIAISWKKNKEIVYFASDRPEGKGGMDIWYSLYDTIAKVFTEPKELSRKVNSDRDEMTPFYDNIGKILYYSSNGRPGVGGFDVFKAEGEESKYDEAENLGFPINSSADDLYYVLNKNGQEGFLVSNKLGGTSLKNETCCDDIYSFYIPNYIRFTVEGIMQEDTNNILHGYIGEQEFSRDREFDETDAFTPRRLNDVQATLYVVDKNTMETTLINKTRTNNKGEYKFTLMKDKNYKIVFNEEGIFLRELEFNTLDPDNNEIILDTVSMIIMPDQPLIIKNIYYEFDRSELSDVAEASIDSTLYQILKEIPKIIVEISAHTDNKGNENYNRLLSQSRAESVVDYLFQKGISIDRLIARGYGETRPLVPNTFPDGTDNPEGREKNRRTQFRIIGRVDEAGEGEIIRE